VAKKNITAFKPSFKMAVSKKAFSVHLWQRKTLQHSNLLLKWQLAKKHFLCICGKEIRSHSATVWFIKIQSFF